MRHLVLACLLLVPLAASAAPARKPGIVGRVRAAWTRHREKRAARKAFQQVLRNNPRMKTFYLQQRTATRPDPVLRVFLGATAVASAGFVVNDPSNPFFWAPAVISAAAAISASTADDGVAVMRTVREIEQTGSASPEVLARLRVLK